MSTQASDKQPEYDVQIGSTQTDPDIVVQVTKDGPYKVSGAPPLMAKIIVVNAEGQSVSYGEARVFDSKKTMFLCRCGHSKNKPFCDGSHLTAGVDLTETASFAPLLQGSQEIDGPVLAVTDNEKYCAFARFCDNGQRIWNEVQMPGEEHEKLTVFMAHHCPSGRLLVWDLEDRKPIEEKEPAELWLIEDPAQGCSGAIALTGGIRVVSAEGRSYEVRNRQTLCRCGMSSNKPFCDGTHAAVKFKDGLTDEVG